MQRALSFLIVLFVVFAASAQLVSEEVRSPAPGRRLPTYQLPTADLGLTKTAISKGPSFVMTVTNYGPNTAPGPIVITDSMPLPARFPNQVVPAPWTCTPAFPTASVTCTHPGPLTPGNSVVLQLRYTQDNSQTDFLNCASVSAKGILDPDERNNRDCACVDVTRCRDVLIDLTTGRENGANLAVNTPDNDWQYVPSSGAAIPSTTANWPWIPPSGSPGTFVNPAAAPGGHAVQLGSGTHTYVNTFTLGSGWGEHQCKLVLRFGADNSVAFLLDGVAIPNAQTPAANTNLPAAWLQLTTVSVPVTSGTHKITAKVNNQSGYTGLYVNGEVQCRCESIN
jgi:hypothetical protein